MNSPPGGYLREILRLEPLRVVCAFRELLSEEREVSLTTRVLFMASAMAFLAIALVVGLVAPPSESMGAAAHPSPATATSLKGYLKLGSVKKLSRAFLVLVSSFGSAPPFATRAASAVLAAQPMLACLEAPGTCSSLLPLLVRRGTDL